MPESQIAQYRVNQLLNSKVQQGHYSPHPVMKSDASHCLWLLPSPILFLTIAEGRQMLTGKSRCLNCHRALSLYPTVRHNNHITASSEQNLHQCHNPSYFHIKSTDTSNWDICLLYEIIGHTTISRERKNVLDLMVLDLILTASHSVGQQHNFSGR